MILECAVPPYTRYPKEYTSTTDLLCCEDFVAQNNRLISWANRIVGTVSSIDTIFEYDKYIKAFIRESSYVDNFLEMNDMNSKEIRQLRQTSENFRRLAEICKLEDNWDSYGAKSFSEELIRRCSSMISKLKYQPEIFPTGRSTIQFEYSNNDDYLEFEISIDSIYMYQEMSDGSVKEGEIEESEVYNLVEEFYANK